MNTTTPKEYQRLLELWAEIADLRMVSAILYWDEQTHMPKSGAVARGDQKGTVAQLTHSRICSPELGKLLEKLRSWEGDLSGDSDEAAIIRLIRQEHERSTMFPARLVQQLSKAQSEAFSSWLEARDAKDFQIFAPKLQRIYDLNREMIEVLGYEEHPLDVLIDKIEPGMKASDVESIFFELKERLIPIVKVIRSKSDKVSNEMLHRPFDSSKQWQVGLEGVRAIGFDLDCGSTDFAVHPFTIFFSPKDVRITTRIKPNQFGPSFFAFLHEAGHGQYLQGIPDKYCRTPLMDGASAGMHESSARTWENLVGRSRGFSEMFYPVVQRAFPEQTKGVTVEDWYRAVNKVKASVNRVQADEVTYNLHVMIRFEIEKALFDGKVNISDLAGLWNEKYDEYLGVTPQDDLEGILQDSHWATNLFGYFQSYTLGNIISVQLYDAALRECPELQGQFARGDYSGLLQWSRKRIHVHGRKYPPLELVNLVSGKPLSTESYINYITQKYGDIYGVEL